MGLLDRFRRRVAPPIAYADDGSLTLLLVALCNVTAVPARLSHLASRIDL